MPKKTKKSFCETCRYYHGWDKIVCAVHPYGLEEKKCRDWQQGEKRANQTKKLRQSITSSSATILAASTLVIAYRGLFSLSVIGIKHSDLKLQFLRQELQQTELHLKQLEKEKYVRQTKIDLKIFFWAFVNASSICASLVLLLNLFLTVIPALSRCVERIDRVDE